MTDSTNPDGSTGDDLLATDLADTSTDADLPEPQLPDTPFGDTVDAAEQSKQTVTNDAVAGETVLPEAAGDDDRSGRDSGIGDGDETLYPGGQDTIAGETVLPGAVEGADTRAGGEDGVSGEGGTRGEAEPDPTLPPGPDTATDASSPAGAEEPLDLRDEDN